MMAFGSQTMVWAVLLLLGEINLGSAFVPLGAGNVALNLLIASR